MTQTNRVPKEMTVKTTAIEVYPPSDFTVLEQQYRLVKYVLPRMLVFSTDDNKYPKMHVEIKEHLNMPYRIFTHDTVGGSKRWSLFALFPVKPDENGEADLNLPELNYAGEPLNANVISFSEPPLHILVKLLQVAYTRKDEEGQKKARFVGNDKCYIYAMRSDEHGRYHKCLEMEIRGDIQNENIFYIDGHARTFALDSTINLDYINQNTYYTPIPIKDDMVIFNQIKRSTVQQYVKNPSSAPPLYRQRTFTGRRTTLDFHSIESQEDTEQTRGYLTDTFIRGFSTYLQNFDFQVDYISRSFKEFVTGSTAEYSLPIEELGTIYVHDARMSQGIALEHFMQPLREKYPEIELEETDSLDTIDTAPLIVIEDCEARAFREGMPLEGQTDPHEEIYRNYPSIPKQFINVNTNALTQRDTSGDENTLSRDDYLSYEPMKLGESQVVMLFNQLYLKDVILNQCRATSRLPVLSDLIFVHREHQVIGGAKRKFETAMHFLNDRVQFYDLINEAGDREAFFDLLKRWNVDWDDNYSKMVDRYRGREDGKDLPTFDVIIGPGLFVEITGASEAVLYDYDEIIRRHEEFVQPFELDDLKLSHKYDDIVEDPELTEDMLELWGYLPHQKIRGKRLKNPKNRIHRDAIALYEKLREYDTLLDDLKGRYPMISFHELTRDEDIVSDIVRLFGSPQTLRNKYKKVGMFLGLREAEVVSVHTGIWYTSDLRYVIGSKTAMNSSQARAHRVRKFIAYQGEGEFDIEPMLEAMSVTFVRLNQYTVYPYYFHLIDIYINNVIKYKHAAVNVLDLDIDLEDEVEDVSD